jgi:NAD(P)H-dependent FMN reductase
MVNFLMITATSGTNLELAERFAGAARDKGHEAEVVDLAAMELPMFTMARSGDPEQAADVSELTQQMIDADAWVVIAPEYNGSVPPTLNNALAWLSRDWKSFRDMCTSTTAVSCQTDRLAGAHVSETLPVAR